MKEIIYRYHAELNTDGRELPGVPLRDLTAEDVERIGAHARAGVDACELFSLNAQPVAEDSGGAALADPRDDAQEKATPAHAPAAVITAAKRQRSIGPSESKATDSDATEL